MLHDKGQWIAEASAISAHLDKQYVEQCLASLTSPPVGLALLAYLRAYLKSSGPCAIGAEVELREQLHELESNLIAAGPFLSGTQMGSSDALLVRTGSLCSCLAVLSVGNSNVFHQR